METSMTHIGTLGIDLIDPHSRDLAWRILANVKIYHTDSDKIWKTADSNIQNAFRRLQRKSKRRSDSGAKEP
jgi:hypothetical protein